MSDSLDFYNLHFPLLDRSSTGLVRETLDRGFDAGWSTTRDGDTTKCVYVGPLNDQNPDWETTEKAINDIVDRRNGSLTVFAKNSDFSFMFHDSWEEFDLPELGGVTLSWERTHFSENAEATVQEVLDAAMLVYESISPPFTFSYLPYGFERETTVQRIHLEERQLPDVFWLMLLSEPVCERVGRSTLETGPTWKVQPLSDGGLGVVVSNDPFRYSRDDKERLKAHLGMNE